MKAYAPDVGGQPIRIGTNEVDRPGAIGLVNADGSCRSYTVRLKEDHDRAHGFLLLPALANPLDAPWADPFDLLEKGGAFVDDGESALAEHLDDPACKMRADPFDQPR